MNNSSKKVIEKLDPKKGNLVKKGFKKSEHDKWKEVRATKTVDALDLDLNENPYWKNVSRCAIL